MEEALLGPWNLDPVYPQSLEAFGVLGVARVFSSETFCS